jgi:carboxymethylenebutenolidase
MIEIDCDGKAAGGYLVEGENSRASIIVIHEWWGLNEHIRDVAGRFAGEGYAVLAPDLYEGKVTKDTEEAGRLMSGLDRSRALEILNGAVEYLRGRVEDGSDRIGVTGFCMGGTFALLLPCYNPSIKAAAPFYGDIPSDGELKNLSAPVLFIGAENDFWITLDKMERLKNKLGELGKKGEVRIYDGVGHAFFNDTRPDAYDGDCAEDAWKRVLTFFAYNL